MKEILTRNLVLKLISVALAFVIWLSVVNVSNPTTSATKQVSVQVLNGDIILDTGKTFDIDQSLTVSVSYNVKTRDLYKIKASDFEAYIDLADLYDVTGSVPVKVRVVNNENLIVGTPVAIPGVLHVTVDDYVRLELGIALSYSGKPQEGYFVSGVSVNPTGMTIRGPKRHISTIEYAQIDVDIEGADANVEGSSNLKFFDAAGNQVDVSDSRITYSRNKASYVVYIETGETPETQPETTVPHPTQAYVPETTAYIPPVSDNPTPGQTVPSSEAVPQETLMPETDPAEVPATPPEGESTQEQESTEPQESQSQSETEAESDSGNASQESAEPTDVAQESTQGIAN